ncbi:hypothetical protein GGX14DRAFT_625388 [Mycena pura]|uniref:TPR-like protein n=1 Tax=Mycena pura TaxID=153505 RepID=A0AAD6VI63_9AGAR|nr:hypothetical protein GGX14DRAFT_625388 [Mycena pura]
MPSLPSATQIRLTSITACLKAAVNTVNILADNPISATTESLTKVIEASLVLVPSKGINSRRWWYFMQSSLSVTLHKIYTFVEAQQDGNKIKILLRLSEMSTLLKDCKTGLQNAFDALKVWKWSSLPDDVHSSSGMLGFPNTYEKSKVVYDILSLIWFQITMRGAERPAQVCWTRPFLQPLSPLDYDAAQKTFIDIAGEIHDSNDVDKILHLTNNMPLAIDLMAHLVDSEGCATVLSRWDTEKTSLVSDGYDRRSNLNMSIALSLSSPRVASVSGTQYLLSLLSMLPDGLSDIELRKSNFPIHNILECKATLLRTSLAYNSTQKRLKVLVPIQEHMQIYHPGSAQSLTVDPLFQHYRELLELYKKHKGPMLAGQVTMSFANIQSLLSFRIQQQQLDHGQTIYSAIYLNNCSRQIGLRTVVPLIDLVAASLPTPSDHGLEVLILSELFSATYSGKTHRAEALIEQALRHFPYFNDSNVKCRFYNSVALYYRLQNDLTLAAEFHQKGLCLSVSTGQTGQQSTALVGLAWIKWRLGEYVTGKALACESQKVAQLSADLRREAHALSIEAACLMNLGSYPKAIVQFERAQSLFTLCDMTGGLVAQNIMNNLAEIYNTQSEYIRARDIHARLLSCAVEQNTYFVARSCLDLAEIDISLDTPIQDVQKNIDTARPLFEKFGYSLGLTLCDAIQANLYLRERNMSAAKQGLERVLRLTLGKYSDMTTYCLESLGDIKRWSSIYWTYIWPTALLVHALKAKQNLVIYKALQFLGDFFLVEGDQTTATGLFTIALDAFTHMDIHK